LRLGFLGAGSAYVAPALFFAGGRPELRVVAVSEAVVAEVGRRLAAVRGAGGVQHDDLAASARRGVLTAARAGDVARLWKAYVDGVKSYLTDPAKQEELRREAERWIKALRLDTTAEEVVSRGLEVLRALRDTGLFDVLKWMAQRLGEGRRGVCGEDAGGAGERRVLARDDAYRQDDKDLRREVRLC